MRSPAREERLSAPPPESGGGGPERRTESVMAVLDRRGTVGIQGETAAVIRIRDAPRGLSRRFRSRYLSAKVPVRESPGPHRHRHRRDVHRRRRRGRGDRPDHDHEDAVDAGRPGRGLPQRRPQGAGPDGPRRVRDHGGEPRDDGRHPTSCSRASSTGSGSSPPRATSRCWRSPGSPCPTATATATSGSSRRGSSRPTWSRPCEAGSTTTAPRSARSTRTTPVPPPGSSRTPGSPRSASASCTPTRTTPTSARCSRSCGPSTPTASSR